MCYVCTEFVEWLLMFRCYENGTSSLWLKRVSKLASLGLLVCHSKDHSERNGNKN